MINDNTSAGVGSNSFSFCSSSQGVIRKHADHYKDSHGDMGMDLHGMRDGYGVGMKRDRDFDDPYGASKMYKPEPGDGVMQARSSWS